MGPQRPVGGTSADRGMSAGASAVVIVGAARFRTRDCESLLRFDLDAGAVGSGSVDFVDWSQDTTAESTAPDPARQPHEAAKDYHKATEDRGGRREHLHPEIVSVPGPPYRREAQTATPPRTTAARPLTTAAHSGGMMIGCAP